MSKVKVSYDFDDTLSLAMVQHHAKLMKKNDYEIWIVTSRLSDEQIKKRHGVKETNWNNDLYFVADQLNIPDERIIFTSYNSKHEFFWSADYEDMEKFKWHLDDDEEEIRNINSLTGTRGVHFPYNNQKARMEVLKNLE